MKVKEDHDIYEIWNEYTCESVYCFFKPTDEEVVEVARQQGWWSSGNKTSMWMKYIKVYKLEPMYEK